MKITVLTSLYPDKGISIYSEHFLSSIAQHNIKIEVISFKKLYPNFLYPNGSKDKKHQNIKYRTNIKIKKIITWYNPFSWIKSGFLISGDIIHIQWWTYFLFPVYFIILLIGKYVKKKKIIIN